MVRPKKNKHIREKLLAEGMSLLSEHGYHGTGLKKILDTVNVPKGSFYNYFKSKEVFVAEIIKCVFAIRNRTKSRNRGNTFSSGIHV